MLIDFELVKRAQSGDQTAFSEIVLAYRKRILGTIARLIARPEDAEDVGQEVFVRLYFSLDRLRSPEAFEPWLYRLTVNLAYDYMRRQRHHQGFRLADLSERGALIAIAEASCKLDQQTQYHTRVHETVQALLRTVPHDDRILLLLKGVEELSFKELAKIYGVKQNALRIRLFRARQRVLKSLERESSINSAASSR